ncbi:MFS transporter [Candidatus Cyrtobacter comes]|uniref:MFS transporter n=1 Tax=Candidatus Cyrtobacter comes TaxID=675776 RepID=A0ABU5L7Y4_9RICK|nr:MFS transporter [Candidatus Cyrtobacter comes]MDZ5761934.1 MFS transporter [Candidatus Cyrtobacter comes]
MPKGISDKKTITVLSIGTFLEYFDLMLYIHMAILLNELFFPQNLEHDPLLISALSYCATFIFRPVAALFFGKLGDRLGRKSIIALSSFIMSITCLIMANLPTYEQIGITATYLFLALKMIQGASSMGEIVSAEIYVIESFKPPKQYLMLNIVNISVVFATLCSILLAYYSTSYDDSSSWRFAFWVGSLMAFVGAFARKKLPETKEFSRKSIKTTKSLFGNNALLNKNSFRILLYLLIEFARPATSYFAYIYCAIILKTELHYSAKEILLQNSLLALFDLLACIFITWLCFKFRPIIILRFKTLIFLPLLICIPYLLNGASNCYSILAIQLILVFFGPKPVPNSPSFSMSFETRKRMTTVSMVFAVSRVLVYVITSFGMAYMYKIIGNFAILIILGPVTFGFLYALGKFNIIEQNLVR